MVNGGLGTTAGKCFIGIDPIGGNGEHFHHQFEFGEFGCVAAVS